jgi:serine/threonine-protein kinase
MIGQTISQYKILEKLGEGGMGIVYKAHDMKLDRIVALKFLPSHLTASETERARFLQEARAASALNHAHVCTIYDIKEEGDRQFIVMEFVDGVTLRHKVPLGKSSEAIGYALEIGEALQEAHSKGIVHRDIKAENIMVNSRNQVKVMDFGLAKLKGSLKLTKASSTVGTLAYMAPEQLEGGEVDARSDIFSFGVLLFELLTGKLPFRGEHEAAMMYSIVNEQPESLLKFRPDAPPELERIINRAVEKEPEDRYQSAADMVSELRRVQKQSSKVSRSSLSGSRPIMEAQVTPATASSAGMRPARTGKGKVFLLIALVVILGGGAAAYFSFFGSHQTIDSIAVLPFTNAGNDPNSEYLSDGITESLINSLSQLPGLTVMSRSSVFHYKGKDIDPQKAGKELGVKAVLTGSVTQRADNLVVSAELVNVSNNTHLWGDQYNRKLSDVLAVQSEISKEISDRLSLKLGGEDQKRLAKNPTENTEAYELYLKGRFYWNKRRADNLLTSMDYFTQAIAKDPNYALAYAGLASAEGIFPEYSGLSSEEYTLKSKAAATKALELDPTLAEPHAVLGLLNGDFYHDWQGAEREFKRAIELNPNFPTTHHWYSICLTSECRFDEALAEINRALQLDPLSLIINENVGDVYLFKKEWDKSEEQFKKTLALDASFPGAHGGLGWAYFYQGKLEESLSEFEKYRATSNSAPLSLSNLGYLYARSGKRDKAMEILNVMLELSGKGNSVAVPIAIVYVGMGENDKALTWLEKGVEVNEPYARGLKAILALDPIRSEPRFVVLLKKIGLDK